jgi:glycosyltransferase involved in cell wall biosynthesis
MGAEVVRGTFGHCGPARNAGLEVATGDVIIVCDADSRLGPDFVASVVQAVDAGYECGGPTLRADEAKAASRFFVAGQNVARAVLRCSYGTAYFATRDLFERGGKYDPSLRWGEDVEISLRHRLVGRACLLPSRVIWSCRRLRENGRLAEVSRRVWRAICYTPTVLARLREAHAALPRRSVHSN